MKKVFFSLMLVASLVFGFTSCDKTSSESNTHSQSFTLGETSYTINNTFTIENIQDESFDGVYNALVFSDGKLVGETGGECQAVILVFDGDIESGTYELSDNAEAFPKYFFTAIEIEDVIDFTLDDLMQQDGVYIASSGSCTLTINDDNTATITTTSVEVEKVKDASVVESSSVDYEGSILRYVLATVEEGNLNNDRIVTAGATKFFYIIADIQVVCFITENGDAIGFQYTEESIPTGTKNVTFLYVQGLDLNTIKAATGEITIAKDGDVYTVDASDITIDGTTYTLHYVGTLPEFELPL